MLMMRIYNFFVLSLLAVSYSGRFAAAVQHLYIPLAYDIDIFATIVWPYNLL